MIKLKVNSLVESTQQKLISMVFEAIGNATTLTPVYKHKDDFLMIAMHRKRSQLIDGEPLSKRRRLKSCDSDVTNNSTNVAKHIFIKEEDKKVNTSNDKICHKLNCVNDPSITLKCYLSCLPNHLWKLIFEQVCLAINCRIGSHKESDLKRIFICTLEIFLCSKLDHLSMSTTSMCSEKDLFQKLRYCYKMKELLIDGVSIQFCLMKLLISDKFKLICMRFKLQN